VAEQIVFVQQLSLPHHHTPSSPVTRTCWDGAEDMDSTFATAATTLMSSPASRGVYVSALIVTMANYLPQSTTVCSTDTSPNCLMTSQTCPRVMNVEFQVPLGRSAMQSRHFGCTNSSTLAYEKVLVTRRIKPGLQTIHILLELVEQQGAKQGRTVFGEH
jgi:hypothetical protein